VGNAYVGVHSVYGMTAGRSTYFQSLRPDTEIIGNESSDNLIHCQTQVKKVFKSSYGQNLDP